MGLNLLEHDESDLSFSHKRRVLLSPGPYPFTPLVLTRYYLLHTPG